MYDEANNLELKLWALDSSTPYQDYHKDARSQGSKDGWYEIYADPRMDTPLGIEVVAHPNFPYGRCVQVLVTYKISGRLTPNYLVLNKSPAGALTTVLLSSYLDFVNGQLVSGNLSVTRQVEGHHETNQEDNHPQAFEHL
ncbi:hypothetical protein LTS14_005911 [Recurvomyces mirabilis]|uniref:uncharacterized protein n=1 Tax=Recurvomyces mirabilis TaxID=574656 RepID=UPI002DDDE3F7|nr:hypothetical protein LTS14_005911 [Recurvomyces mirabilis]